jgi:chromosome segregation ATPase
MAANRDALKASLSQTQSQMESLRMKLDQMSQEKPAAPAVKEAAPPQTARHRTAHHTAVERQPREDPRWNRMQSELDAQQREIVSHQQQIEATQANLLKTRSELEGNLNSTRDALNGSIARTHEQLVELEKRGQRNFTEFDLEKSKRFSHVGPVSLALRKANVKHQYCDLQLLVDDVKLTKKHVNLYEPVMFYPQGYSQPLELVIYRISRDSAQGYVSTPKYAEARQAVSTAAAQQPVPAAETAQSQLEHRPESPQ